MERREVSDILDTVSMLHVWNIRCKLTAVWMHLFFLKDHLYQRPGRFVLLGAPERKLFEFRFWSLSPQARWGARANRAILPHATVAEIAYAVPPSPTRISRTWCTTKEGLELWDGEGGVEVVGEEIYGAQGRHRHQWKTHQSNGSSNTARNEQ